MHQYSTLPTAPKRSWQWYHKAAFDLLVLFFLAIGLFDARKKNASKPRKETSASSSTKAEADGEDAEKSSAPPSPRHLTSHWRKFHQHPFSQRARTSVLLTLLVLAMSLVFGFHLLFWPSLFLLSIALQCAMYEDVHPGTPAPFPSIAITSTLHLATWTLVLGVFLVVKKPNNRAPGVLWQCLKWTHAVNWWLFWGVLELHFLTDRVRRWIRALETTTGGGVTTGVVLSIVWPSLVAYLYCGVVCDVVVAARLIKFLWNNDVTKL